MRILGGTLYTKEIKLIPGICKYYEYKKLKDDTSNILNYYNGGIFQIKYLNECICFTIEKSCYMIKTDHIPVNCLLPKLIDVKRITWYMFTHMHTYNEYLGNRLLSIHDDELFDFNNGYFELNKRIEACTNAIINALAGRPDKKEMQQIEKRLKQINDQM